MSFDSKRFSVLVTELEKLEQREAEIKSELRKLLGEGPRASQFAPAKVAKPKAKSKKKGQLLETVRKVLGNYSTPVTLTVLSKAVNKQRPGTKPAAVASVLHSLAKRGIVIKNAPNVFYLPPVGAAPSNAPAKAAPAAVKASEPVEELES